MAQVEPGPQLTLTGGTGIAQVEKGMCPIALSLQAEERMHHTVHDVDLVL
jgi:hypothetical protein